MARKGLVQNDLKRRKLVKKFLKKRQELKKITMNKTLSLEERFFAQIKLAQLPRNSSKVRVRNRCAITGRARGYYRRFGVSRITLRELASFGKLPGVTKSSW
ncbi:MAG: 30S ribosomal protein S14 [Rickettsiales bacterium]|nr:30S ribosomal protein S14 [Rickettsiales bacterium]